MSNEAGAPSKTDCVFCRIITKELPADVVAENAHALAFTDLSPGAPTHVLVVPKRHIRDATELSTTDGALLCALIELANDVAHRKGIDRSGFRLVLNVGDDAGNTVEHLHLHLLGGRSFSWPPG